MINNSTAVWFRSFVAAAVALNRDAVALVAVDVGTVLVDAVGVAVDGFGVAVDGFRVAVDACTVLFSTSDARRVAVYCTCKNVTLTHAENYYNLFEVKTKWLMLVNPIISRFSRQCSRQSTGSCI